MSSPSYKYCCTLLKHRGDVRGVKAVSDRHILSASRDQYAIFWSISDQDMSSSDDQQKTGLIYEPEISFAGHSDYVSCCTYLQPNEIYPEGAFLTGSNDNKIRAFTTASNLPCNVLEGHSDTVTSLSVSSDGRFIISGSWDKTVCIWRTNGVCVARLSGHQAAVWAVQFISLSPDGKKIQLASGSADKTVKLWTVTLPEESILEPVTQSSATSTFSGHGDCVRSLALINSNLLVSASNDGSLRAWNLTTGVCVAEFYGHTNFVYSLAVRSDLGLLVSSGEDRTVRVWPLNPSAWQANGNVNIDCLQAITLPCISVWCVDILPNGDIVAGGSDHQIRVFSRDPSRQAPLSAQETFSNEVASAQVPKQATGGEEELDEQNLPGSEALLNPGRKEGQVLLIKEEGKIICYQWSTASSEWIKVGDVVGSESKKKLYQGKEYDFVFDVDFDPTRPTSKLPFNLSQDPWSVAQDFIFKHDLPQDYLDTIVRYIQQNAGLDKNQQRPAQSQVQFTDPFTGDCRYVPGSDQSPVSSIPKPSQVFFPAKSYVPMISMNMPALVAKLQSCHAGDIDQSMINEKISKMSTSSRESEVTEVTMALLPLLAKWPQEDLLPLLDLLRFTVQWRSSLKLITKPVYWTPLFDRNLSKTSYSAKNALLLVRLVANAVQPARDLALLETESSLQELKTLCDCVHPLIELVEQGQQQLALRDNKMMQVALATLFHNMIVLGSDHHVISKLAHELPILRGMSGICLRFAFRQLCLVAQEGVKKGFGAIMYAHAEAVFRNLITVGTALETITKEKTERVALITSLMFSMMDGQSSPNAITPEPGSDAFQEKWDETRDLIAFWAKTEVVPIKTRECAAAILTCLEE